MAAGLPVVACDAPGVRAVVGEGRAAGGVVVPREDVGALATELARLLADRTQAAAAGDAARRRAESTFSLDAVGAQLRALLVDR
jgi:starch synthase